MLTYVGWFFTQTLGTLGGFSRALLFVFIRCSMQKKILTIRALSGLSGDMLLAGLCRMQGLDQAELDALVATLNLPHLVSGCVQVKEYSLQHIGGWRAYVDLPHEHAHRSLLDITEIIEKSAMAEKAKKMALVTFALLAEAEGKVHGIAPSEVTFHEVGALDSIVDICLGCLLFERLGNPALRVSPLPLADGHIACAHGIIPSPAPAVLQLLEGVEVCSFDGVGETVTPTALALLQSWGAVFGAWPHMRVEKTALVYGSKVFEGVANGAVFASGYGVE